LLNLVPLNVPSSPTANAWPNASPLAYLITVARILLWQLRI
jgi:hypothetical protein